MQKMDTSLMKQVARQYKRLMQSATQRVMSISAIGMLLALLVDVLIAARLGTSVSADALIIALSLPRLIETVAREGTKFSLVSLFVELRYKLSTDLYNQFVSSLLNLVIVIGLLFTIIGWMFASPIIHLLGPGLPFEGKQLAAILFRLVIPQVIFALGSTVFGILLNSQRHFNLVAARNSAGPLVVVLAIGLAWNRSAIVIWIASAYLIGYALFFCLLAWQSVVKTGFRPTWRAWPDKKTFQPVWESITYPTGGFALRQVARIVERMLASMVSVGGVSAYYFASRLFSASQSLIGVSAATTALPSLAQYGISEKNQKLATLLRKRLLQIICVSSPVSLFMMVFSRQIMRLLYARGAFNENSIAMSSTVLFWLASGFIFATMVPVMFSSIYALKDIKGAFRIIFRVALVNVGLAVPLSLGLGLPGLAIAATMTAIFSFMQIAWHLKNLGVPIWGKRETK